MNRDQLIEKVEELLVFLEDNDVCDEHYLEEIEHGDAEVINSTRTKAFQEIIDSVREELEKIEQGE